MLKGEKGERGDRIMTDLQNKMIEKVGLSKDDFEPINKEELLEEAYLKCEYNSILIEKLMEE